jgi:hypothetical protein
MSHRRIISVFLLAVVGLVLAGCSDSGVKSGTYDGTIKEINVGETEIYVETPDGTVLELYFTETTRVVNADGSEATFADLSVDQKVSVEVENVDGDLKPVKVVLK